MRAIVTALSFMRQLGIRSVLEPVHVDAPPPAPVTPSNTPFCPAVTPACVPAPSLPPWNEYNTLSVPVVPYLENRAVYVSLGAASVRGPVEFAVAARQQTGVRIASIGRSLNS
jgi:hypothetical protein